MLRAPSRGPPEWAASDALDADGHAWAILRPMVPLLDKLIARGDLYPVAAGWARAHQNERGGTLDSALLDLDVIDEEGLLKGLESCLSMTAATPADLAAIDPELAEQLPKDIRLHTSMCPVRLSGEQLVAMARAPLSDKLLEKLRALGLQVRQLVAPAHYVALARGRVFGSRVNDHTEALEARLARRRDVDLQRVLAKVAEAPEMVSATAAVLDLSASLLDFCCLFEVLDEGLRVLAARGGLALTGPFPVPDGDCTLAATFQRGAKFAGPLAGSDLDRRLYQALRRPPPKWVFAVPVLANAGSTTILYADNGPRGMAPRWVAELTLLAARLSRRAGGAVEHGQQAAQDDEDQAAAVAQQSPAERAALEKLQQACAEAGVPLGSFVDALLRGGKPQTGPDSATVDMDAVQELIQKLAADIPKQLSVGIQSALRNMPPRYAAAPGALPAGAVPRSPASTVDLVHQEAGPRKVGDYRSRRKRTRRIDL